ncbi:RNA polymerase II C-terminal domain phosphatase-like 5 [Brassica napus]|uniref:RNA polymerase II C-terminal domain phosphatase-like 5 n=1 Tax=Brassica napus TaxID=3708 RepID=UPI00207A7DF8|nr:RNA polymerase II C-terminal domain phosphatase-like 5 [Brassica napus]
MACVHDIVQDGFCTHCKRAVDTQHHAFIPFYYLKNGLEFRPEYVGTMKRHVWMKSLMEKKLTLVLSLHDTLYDSRPVSLLSEKEKYLTVEVESKSDDMWRSKTTRHPEFSYAEERIDEDAEDGGLANALELLKEVHRKFFTEKDEDLRDVRALLFPLES